MGTQTKDRIGSFVTNIVACHDDDVNLDFIFLSIFLSTICAYVRKPPSYVNINIDFNILL